METSEIVTRYAVSRLSPEGIVLKVTSPGAEYTLADAREELEAVWKISGGRRRPLLADIRNIKSIDQDARSFYAGAESASRVAAVALLISSPLSRIIGNFFLGMTKSSISIKLYTSEAAAMAWLRGFIEPG